MKTKIESGDFMFKYAGNPIFWTTAAVILVTLADLAAAAPVPAATAAALYFLIWWGFYIYRHSLARRWDLMLPHPDGVCVSGPGRLQAVPYLYLGAQALFSLICLVLTGEWTAMIVVLVLCLLGALVILRGQKKAEKARVEAIHKEAKETMEAANRPSNRFAKTARSGK